VTDLDSAFERAIAAFPDHPEWHELGVEPARELEAELFSRRADGDVATTDRTVERPGDGGAIPVRLYRPPGLDEPAPALVFAHGGGFVLGTLDSADDLARRLAATTGSVVVSVDYRLAPEHPCPAGLADVTTVVEWTAESAADCGADPARVGVAGSSAGANLAAMAARRADATVDVAVLCYPMLDPTLGGDSHAEHADAPLLTRADLDWFWRLYRDDGAIPVDDPRLSPLPGVEPSPLGDSPPTVVVTAGCDPLRDDGARYAAALADVGVAVERLHYPGAPHGFLSLADAVPAAADAWDDLAAAVLARR
jgi:acetyl esterase